MTLGLRSFFCCALKLVTQTEMTRMEWNTLYMNCFFLPEANQEDTLKLFPINSVLYLPNALVAGPVLTAPFLSKTLP